ncbi:cytochrome P450 [Streptomyces sp. NBC_01471]|uniref:cytochrome P450 n=1 Tax=Streptomyces sp. NBC_01471 TaxID=2903879 RepID=UPI0032527A6E
MLKKTTGAALAAGSALLLSSPAWLPGRIVSLRMKLFARINGDEGLPFPQEEYGGAERFEEIYGQPAANGRSRGAALSDLFWYWLAPGADIHQEHLEAGPRYDEVSRRTLAILAGPSAGLYDAAARSTRHVLDALPGDGVRSVRLRDLMMPVWAEFFYTLVFQEDCPPEARKLIVDNAEDVVNALKCTRLRHMRRRDRLTRYLLRRLDAGEVPHVLPAGLSRRQHAYYLQGTFFNTAVVQMSEAMAHLLLVLAQHPEVQERVTASGDDDRWLSHVMNETFRLFPLFGVAHRITTADIDLDGMPLIPSGSVLTFSYPDYQAAGYTDPEDFVPGRWETLTTKEAHHIPFGIAANRPCPAWRLSPIAMRAATREVLARFELDSPVSHTRSIPHRAPCLLIPRNHPADTPRRRVLRTALAVRDRAEDVGRSLTQLVLGTYMVLDARRTRPAARFFAEHDTEGHLLQREHTASGADGRYEPAITSCPYPGRST